MKKLIDDLNKKLLDKILKDIDSEPIVFENVTFTDVKDFDKPIKYYGL